MTPIKVTDHSVSQEKFVLIYDSDYELYKTNPLPHDLSKYYESNNYISHTDAKQSLIEKVYQIVKKKTLKNKEKLVSSLTAVNNKSILDIGSGTGSFLEVLNKNGWHSIGVEPNKKARELSKEKNAISVNTSEEIQNHTFDVITMWHVLEHVPNLEQQFQEFKRLLNANGSICIAVPNYKSYDAKYYKSFWAAYDVPRHIWHFSEMAIQKISERHGFELVKTKPMWFDSFYVSLLSEKYKKGKVNYLVAFSIGLLSNLKAIINNQFSSKIYVLKQKSSNKAI